MSHFRWRILVLGALLVLLFVIGGVAFVSYQEQDSRFCVSCHTQPETEYFARYLRAVQNNSAQDLASFHYSQKQTRCIDCHVGEGFLGRSQVLTIAAWDAFKHYTGIARQPAVIVVQVQNEGCTKCHADVVRRTGFENHLHNILSDPTAPFIRCTDCHISHRPGDERTAFQFRDAILPQCEYCHTQMGRGPRGLTQ